MTGNDKSAEEQKQNKDNLEEDEEQKKQLQSLNNSLLSTITEYTKIRNEHAKRLENQLCTIRCDIERRIRSTDLDNFDKQKIGSVCNEILNNLRQKGRQLCEHCDAIKISSENINQLKIFFSEWKNESIDGSGKSLKRFGSFASSFDFQKRLELLENQYEKSLNDFERTKDDLDSLNKNLEYQGNFLQSSCQLPNDSLTPIEQHQLIRTNDNISKMCTKLETRIRQIRTQIEQIESKKLGEKSKNNKTLQILSKDEFKGSDDIASFCVLKLEQLNIFDDKNNKKATIDNNCINFRQNLFNFMANHNQYKIPLEGNGIRLIQPIKSSIEKIVVPSKEKQNNLSLKNNELDEQKLLKNLIIDEIKQKPQMVSIGIQSPDFLVKSPQKFKKPSTKIKSTPETPKTIFDNSSKITPKNIGVGGGITGFSFGGDSTTPKSSKPKSNNEIASSQLFSFKTQKPADLEVKPIETTPTSQNKISSSPITSTITTSTTTPAAIITISSSSSENLPQITTTTTTISPITTTNNNNNVIDLPITPTLKENEETTKIKESDELKNIKNNLLPQINNETKEKKEEEAKDKTNKIQQQQTIIGGDEGMEDEIIVAMGPNNVAVNNSTSQEQSSISSVNFNFMGGLGATSTPVNTNKSAFGSIAPKTTSTNIFGGGSPQQQQQQPIFGSSTLGSSNIFASANQNNSGGAFASFGALSANSGSSGFGASPFASATSVFGAAPVFGKSSPFGSTSPFGGGAAGSTGSGSGGSGGSMFGGGFKTGSTTTGIGTTGFSAFASKSSAFGQLASQTAQQNVQQPTSLFGGGNTQNTSGGGTFFGGFGGSPTSTTTGIKPFGQQKSSAFTTFRK